MASSDQPCNGSAAALGRLLAAGERNAIELTEYFIERIDAWADPAVFTATSFERARREANASAQRYRTGNPLGPLDGVPLAWKDLFDVAGLPTTAASALYRDAPPATADAPVVANAAAAGMVTLGKTNLTEFAYSTLGLNPHFGTPRNPRARGAARVPGGSSSGAGVAVAAGLVPVAVGTDTGGSVRIPAAFNGIIGYKTSESRYDKPGVFPLSPTLDTVGVLARDVTDCRLLDQALRGRPVTLPAAASTGDMSGIRLLVPENVVLDDLQPEVEANFMASLERLRAAGAAIGRRAIPELDALQTLSREHGYLASAEAYCRHHDLLESPRGAAIDPFVFQRIMAAKRMSAYDLLRLQQERLRLSASMWAAVGDDMLLVMPTIAHVAPLLAPLQDDPALFRKVNAKTNRNTMWGNMLNVCALAMPNGLGEAGMPTSIACHARAGREDSLLTIGAKLASVVAQPGSQI